MMSGIEIAGLVLGSFPIILNCLDYYRKGFEPLEDWWNFRTHFIAFIDDISHQMMRYNGNMIRLLDPIVADSDSLTTLVGNANDPRWIDGSLAHLLEQRLASEHKRFLRIIQRMEEEIRELKRFLGIKDGAVRWIRSDVQRPWEWHMKRFQISFSKGKTKKIKILATRNQELQEILGYSERVIPIADKRNSSGPVALFDKMCQHACAMHNALAPETKTMSYNFIFVLDDEQESLREPRKQEVTIKPVKEDATAPLAPTEQFSHVQQAESFTAIQESFKDTKSKIKKPGFTRLLSKAPISTQQVLSYGKRNILSNLFKGRKQARFATPTPAIIIGQEQANNLEAAPSAGSNVPSQRIADLCSFLRNCPDPNLGIIVDEFDRQFQLLGPGKSSPASVAPKTARLIPLPEILDAYYQASIDIARHRRFEMAVHIASALLHIHTSPWVSSRLSKHQFFFLADAQNLYSDYPYVSQMFIPSVTDPRMPENRHSPPPFIREEETRACLFTVGVIILELVFGHNIEACSFRHLYYGSNNQPNDQTEVSTARKWSQKVLGECGIEIADVVRRCLDCSFGPRPDLKDKRFREAVYDGVIRPLADHLKIWQVTMP
ncbi:MAG: hypothetical protein ASARMPREDX12_000882 [Alectoria sarmentosa]|nr:MAG: hypothetical protein ASARMPREDX12_000882 [Alectoria sarmentosa]